MKLYSKRSVVLLISICFFICIFYIPGISADKGSGKITVLKLTMERNLKKMNFYLDETVKLKEKSRKLAVRIRSMAGNIVDLLDNCSGQNPAVDIPAIRTRMRIRGFNTGKISIHNQKYYAVPVTGLNYRSRVTLKPLTKIPFILLVALVRGELDFEDNTWNRYIVKVEGMRSGANTNLDDLIPTCNSRSFRDLFIPGICGPNCQCYFNNARRAKESADRLYKYHIDALKGLQRNLNMIDDMCSRGPISERNKRSLRRCVNSIKDNINNSYSKFDLYINRIKDAIRRYKPCKRNEIPVLRG